jgi:hypothetical protein
MFNEAVEPPPLLRNYFYVMRHFMRLFKFIVLIFVATFYFGFKPLPNPVSIKGHIRKNPKDTSAYIDHLYVTVKADNKILANTMADDKGNFVVKFTPNNEKTFDFFVNGVAIDTLFVGSVKTFSSDKPDLTLYIPALTKRNFFGQTICPKCNKADKVYKIRYGDGLPLSSVQISENGDTTISPIVNGRYNAGTCIVGVATYYCDRDRVQF